MLNRSMKTLGLLAMSVIVGASLFCPAAEAGFKKQQSCKSGKCPPKIVEEFDDQTKVLITALSQQPELMNVEYLKYFIGRPENEKAMRGQLTKHYYWYDGQHNQIYQLDQIEQSPGRVVSATFVANLYGNGLTFDKVHDMFGTESHRFFNYSGHPSELFSFAPDTFLTFSSPADSFRLNEAKIFYRGNPLPPPSTGAMQAAESSMNARAAQALNNATGDELIALMQARVKTHPFDAEAHLRLAQAFSQESRVNDAIGEYKVALAMSGTDQDVRNQSMSALRRLHIINDAPDPYRHFEIVQHGQRMRVKGREKQPTDKDNQAPNQS